MLFHLSRIIPSALPRHIHYSVLIEPNIQLCNMVQEAIRGNLHVVLYLLYQGHSRLRCWLISREANLAMFAQDYGTIKHNNMHKLDI